MQKAGDYSEGYYIYGLSVSSAEGLAEWTHKLVLNGVGLPQGRDGDIRGVTRLAPTPPSR